MYTQLEQDSKSSQENSHSEGNSPSSLELSSSDQNSAPHKSNFEIQEHLQKSDLIHGTSLPGLVLKPEDPNPNFSLQGGESNAFESTYLANDLHNSKIIQDQNQNYAVLQSTNNDVKATEVGLPCLDSLQDSKTIDDGLLVESSFPVAISDNNDSTGLLDSHVESGHEIPIVKAIKEISFKKPSKPFHEFSPSYRAKIVKKIADLFNLLSGNKADSFLQHLCTSTQLGAETLLPVSYKLHSEPILKNVRELYEKSLPVHKPSVLSLVANQFKFDTLVKNDFTCSRSQFNRAKRINIRGKATLLPRARPKLPKVIKVPKVNGALVNSKIKKTSIKLKKSNTKAASSNIATNASISSNILSNKQEAVDGMASYLSVENNATQNPSHNAKYLTAESDQALSKSVLDPANQGFLTMSSNDIHNNSRYLGMETSSIVSNLSTHGLNSNTNSVHLAINPNLNHSSMNSNSSSSIPNQLNINPSQMSSNPNQATMNSNSLPMILNGQLDQNGYPYTSNQDPSEPRPYLNEQYQSNYFFQ